MHDHLPSGGGVDLLAVLAPILAVVAAAAYLVAVVFSRRPWPRHRTLLWLAGLLTASAAVSRPLAGAARAQFEKAQFEGHMVAHLLLGMLAPLLLVLAAPVTLILRALPVPSARGVSRALGSWPIRFLTEPVVAAVLNVGGLWLLYTTGIFPALHTSPAINLAVHVHMFAAGTLFTVALVSPDPMPHRRSYGHRAAVLIAALAAHDILAKYLYAHPPIGVSADAAHAGAMIMYYGGDAVDVALIVVLCAGWYRARRRGASLAWAWPHSRRTPARDLAVD